MAPRVGSKVSKKYDKTATLCGRLLACSKVDEETKEKLCQTRAALDPMSLADEVAHRLGEIFEIVERIAEEHWKETKRAGERPAREGGKPSQSSINQA